MEVVDNNSSADLLDLNETLSLEEDEERKLLLKINSSFGAWLVFMEMSLALIGKFFVSKLLDHSVWPSLRNLLKDIV